MEEFKEFKEFKEVREDNWEILFVNSTKKPDLKV